MRLIEGRAEDAASSAIAEAAGAGPLESESPIHTVQRRGGVLRGRIRALVRRRAQTA